MHASRHIACVVLICLALCIEGRVLSGVRAPDDGTTAGTFLENDTARSLEGDLHALQEIPQDGVAAANFFDVSTRLVGISVNRDWRPYVVLAVGELLGYIVRSITGFGSAIVIVACWTVCQTCGLDAGPFQSLIFADSICSLASAAPLVYITKPWHYASWKIVVTLLCFQAVGATAGAYLVQHLEPHNLQFAIASSLLVVFILMVCPLAKLLSHLKAASTRKEGTKEPLLPHQDTEGAPEKQSWRQWLGFGLGPKGAGQHEARNDEQSGEAKAASLQEAERTPGKAAESPFADLKDRRFSEDDWEVMRSRVRRLGRSGTAGSPASAGPGPLAGSREPEPGRHIGSESARQGLVDDHSDSKCAAPLPLSRRQSDSASSLRAGEGLCRARGNNVPGTSPASIQEEPEEGKAADENFATSDLPPGPSRPPMVQQKSGSFRQREAERMRRFIIARQLSGGSAQNGEAPLPLNDPILATEEADALAQSTNQVAAHAHHYEQGGAVGVGEVIKGSLSAEVGSLLIGVVSHAGSPRPESPQRLGSIAHIGHVEEGPMREASAGEAEAAPLLERSASQKARQWTIATPLLLAAGALAGTSGGCLATLSGIGGPPLILMYELLAVPKQVVRATQTTMGLVSVKFFTYLLLGAGSWSNLPLYGMAIVCSLIGLNIGNAISKRMDQRMFSNLLLGIMLLSTALLYAASYGLTGR